MKKKIKKPSRDWKRGYARGLVDAAATAKADALEYANNQYREKDQQLIARKKQLDMREANWRILSAMGQMMESASRFVGEMER